MPEKKADKPKTEKKAQKKVTLDGDKGMYTHKEVAHLLAEAGVNFVITLKDGVSKDARVEDNSSDDAGDDSGEDED